MPKIEISIPNDYLCSITHELMRDPVTTADGYVYERKAIQKWLQKHATSPVTNLKLKNKELMVVPFIKNQIQSFLEKNKICTKEEFLSTINEIASKHKMVYKIQKLNYLDSYLTGQIKLSYGLRATQALTSFTPLHVAAYYSHRDLVGWLLAEGANPKSKNGNGDTPLHVTRCAEVATLLLAEGADLDDKNNKGETPLYCAAARACVEMVKLLLNKGADPQTKDNYDNTPEGILNDTKATMVIGGITSDDYDQINYLLKVAQPNFKANYGSELHLAIRYHQLDKVKREITFMRKEKGELEKKDEYGWTPLSLAASLGFVEAVKALLIEQVDLNTKTESFEETNTPLHHAVLKGHLEIVQLLLEYGADVNVLDHDHLTPEQLAEKKGNAAIVKLFQLYEKSPKKVAELEKITQQQNRLIQQMQEQIKALTLQVQQLTDQQKNTRESKKAYSPSFDYSKQ